MTVDARPDPFSSIHSLTREERARLTHESDDVLMRRVEALLASGELTVSKIAEEVRRCAD